MPVRMTPHWTVGLHYQMYWSQPTPGALEANLQCYTRPYTSPAADKKESHLLPLINVLPSIQAIATLIRPVQTTATMIKIFDQP